MQRIAYLLARALIAVLQMLPLRWVARAGRFFGGFAYLLDARHRRVAIKNLQLCFGNEMSLEQITALARENFKRIGEAFACAVKTADMTAQEMSSHLTFQGVESLQVPPGQSPGNIIIAIGHFGNFEVYVRYTQMAPAYQGAVTYRALRQPLLNRLMQQLREKSGCLFFERRSGASDLKQLLNKQGVLLGLLADQHAGDNGLRVPFFGRECSTSAAPAVFALRYDCPLYAGFCFRTGLAQWRIEHGPLIPTRENGRPREVEDIARDMNLAFEAAIRRDPSNWFWVHNRWKPLKPRPVRVIAKPVDSDEALPPSE